MGKTMIRRLGLAVVAPLGWRRWPGRPSRRVWTRRLAHRAALPNQCNWPRFLAVRILTDTRDGAPAFATLRWKRLMDRNSVVCGRAGLSFARLDRNCFFACRWSWWNP